MIASMAFSSVAVAQATTTPAPAAVSTDSIAGKWKAGGSTSKGIIYMILDIAQRGDSLSATATQEKDGVPTDLQVELVGMIHDGKLELQSSDGSLHITGTHRKEIIRARVMPGRYKNILVLGEATFTPWH
jgi:hypothetical protein